VKINRFVERNMKSKPDTLSPVEISDRWRIGECDASVTSDRLSPHLRKLLQLRPLTALIPDCRHRALF
jgi:hypothetical protein